VLMDGMRFRDCRQHYGMRRHFWAISTSSIPKRVEVLRGSGPRFYGSNALGGVINIHHSRLGGGRHMDRFLAEGGGLGRFAVLHNRRRFRYGSVQLQRWSLSFECDERAARLGCLFATPALKVRHNTISRRRCRFQETLVFESIPCDNGEPDIHCCSAGKFSSTGEVRPLLSQLTSWNYLRRRSRSMPERNVYTESNRSGQPALKRILERGTHLQASLVEQQFLSRDISGCEDDASRGLTVLRTRLIRAHSRGAFLQSGWIHPYGAGTIGSAAGTFQFLIGRL
jgi:hypothetical protein